MIAIYFLLIIIPCLLSQPESLLDNQKWGFISVRPHAHMFYWLYYTKANVSHYSERPLIVWLQGGPGMSSSCYGNFIEIGPLDANLEIRNHSWIEQFNVVFLDNPVGVGFSYRSNDAVETVTSNKEIGNDLISFTKGFLSEFGEFRRTPLYIFGESYGGKMAVEFARQLNKEIKNGSIVANFQGIGLGDAYISPIDYALNFAPLALALGFLDKHNYNSIQAIANNFQKALADEEYKNATTLEYSLLSTFINELDGVDIYNIMVKSDGQSLLQKYQSICDDLINNKITPSLNLPSNLTWTYFNSDVNIALINDWVRSETRTVEKLLDGTNLKIIVYNGAMDFIVNTAGTVSWLGNLNWTGKGEWQRAKQSSVKVNNISEAFVKKVKNLVFYNVLRSGHSVPMDNPIAMEEILRRELLL